MAKNQDKINTLRYFIQGVNAIGDTGIVSDQQIYQPADVAVILGWVHENGKTASHLQFRQEIVDRQKQSGGRTIIADSNLFLYKNTGNPGYWLRYSYDGVFPNTGEYCDANPDPQRWIQVQRHLGVALKEYRLNGEHILLCLQRDGGWSMGGFDVVDWALQTIQEIRKYTDRPIVIRPHPGDKRAIKYCHRLIKLCQGRNLIKVSLSQEGSTLEQDLKKCWAMVNHNSSPAVAAVIEGIPAFVTDPLRSQCREVSNHQLNVIESPVLHDRLSWIQRISQFHWSHQDLQQGLCWSHMRKWAKL